MVGPCDKLVRHQPECILKDNDIKRQNKLCFPQAIAETVVEILKADVEFLSKTYQTMDYSLLGTYNLFLL
jgi:hypothetical protein